MHHRLCIEIKIIINYYSYPICRNQLFYCQIINEVVKCVGVRGQCVIIIKPIHFNMPKAKLIIGKDRLLIYEGIIF